MITAQAPSPARTTRRWRATTSAFSAAIDLLQYERTAEEDQHGYGHSCDQEGDGGTPRVLRADEEVHHQVPDHHAVDSADKLWGEVLAEDRNEDEDHRSDHPGADLRNQNVPDRGQGRCAKVHSSLELVPVKAFEGGVEGQGGKRKVQIDEHEDDRPPVVQQE